MGLPIEKTISVLPKEKESKIIKAIPILGLEDRQRGRQATETRLLTFQPQTLMIEWTMTMKRFMIIERM